MKETSVDFTESLDDELLPEYDLDYSKAKSNRFVKHDRDRLLKVIRSLISAMPKP